MLPATPVKYWTQSVGALEIFDKIEKKINIVDLQYLDIIDLQVILPASSAGYLSRKDVPLLRGSVTISVPQSDGISRTGSELNVHLTKKFIISDKPRITYCDNQCFLHRWLADFSQSAQLLRKYLYIFLCQCQSWALCIQSLLRNQVWGKGAKMIDRKK